MIGLISLALSALGVNELIVLAGAGIAMGIGQWISVRWKQSSKTMRVLLPLLPSGLWKVIGVSGAAATPFGIWPLFLFFLKVGSILFGSGYVLVAFLRADLVERWGWLTESQLIDAVAVGQVTPGPVFTTATFIGYLLGGPMGAVTATVGIFLPAFVFVAISGPLVQRIRNSVIAGAALDGINIASLALMASVTWQLGRAALVDPITISVFLASVLLLLRFRLNSAWLVVGGAVIGLLIYAFSK
jgi:chromate transporter